MSNSIKEDTILARHTKALLDPPAGFFPGCRLFVAFKNLRRPFINHRPNNNLLQSLNLGPIALEVFAPVVLCSCHCFGGWRLVEKEVKKVVKKLKRVVVLEDAKFKQFRDQGIDPELESKMDELFGGHLFNTENNGTSILGPEVSAWQELWHDDSPVSTPPPLSQGVDGGGNRKGKRKLENLSMDPNKSAKTNGPKRMRLAAMMYEKLDAMLEVIISEKKAREVEREERREIRQRKEMNNKNGSGDNGAHTIRDALAKICALPHFDLLHPASCSFVDLDS
ncbi:hypothetical protein Cgig2_023011 [Carnegiea gigantea]|uniref:Uncharacterized protein n=1 Tax=Carnegiea gigantea TaxID=171969 RepID=A0A9Q1K9E1_9CARY|nr:hypothetical protein Cgig2_023011 [Carnegiea gigantea]